MKMIKALVAAALLLISTAAQPADYRLSCPTICNTVIRTADGVSISNQDPVYLAWLAVPNVPDPYVVPPPQFASSVNWVINPNGIVDQAAGTYTNLANAAYGCDQWYALRQTSDTGNGMSCRTSIGTGPLASTPAINRVQTNATAQRLGLAQALEFNDTLMLLGKEVNYYVALQPNATLNMRVALLAWTGTFDAPVLDQVNSWTNTTYTAGQFFKSTTLTVVCVSASVVGTANVPTSGSCRGTVPTGATNLIVMAWSEGTMANGNAFYSWGHTLNVGGGTIDTIPRNYTEELKRAQRFYEVARTAVYSPADATASGVGNHYSFKVQKVKVPTVTVTAGAVINTFVDWVSFNNATTTNQIITINARF
jgi:hypothetical protein